MASCYKCGRFIPPDKFHIRRRVKVGELERRAYPHRKPNSVHSRYGYRIVCTHCAHGMDTGYFKEALLNAAKVALILLALCLFLILQK